MIFFFHFEEKWKNFKRIFVHLEYTELFWVIDLQSNEDEILIFQKQIMKVVKEDARLSDRATGDIKAELMF